MGPEKGWGVVADEQINIGEFVVEYVGELIDAEEAQRRQLKSELDHDYHFALSRNNSEHS
jgi:SET domain-containing protein